MDIQVTNHRDYVITIEQGDEKGIFFRSPLQKAFFNTSCGVGELSVWNYRNKLENPIRKIYELLIGNGSILKSIMKCSRDLDWVGFQGNVLCSPIYFKRKYRKLVAISRNGGHFKKIESYGYQNEFCNGAGECVVEKTRITISPSGDTPGGVIRIKRPNSYKYTYPHVVEGVLDCKYINTN